MTTETKDPIESPENRTYVDTLRAIFGDPIHVVTREQLLADGELVDISEHAKPYGITFPVAMSRRSYIAHAEWTDEDKRGLGQSTAGRLMDVCAMLRHFIRSKPAEQRSDGTQCLRFSFYRIPREGKGTQPRQVTLKSICGPDDYGTPCITILELDED
jgi:hypothetical protein